MFKGLSEKYGLPLHALRYDIPAGLVVFLVALPLCLGIAIASGAPPLSGIISGVIGGVLVGMLSNSHTGVSGPAAGLVVVVLQAMEKMGSFEALMVAILLAGILQLIWGLSRVGTIGSFFPSSVIKGMLAAIGLILIMKEVPHALGYDKDHFGDLIFWQQDGNNTFTALWKATQFFQPGAVIISLISLCILLFYEKMRHPIVQILPSALVVVVLGIFINDVLWMRFVPEYYLGQEHLVRLPTMAEVGGFGNLFLSPDFSVLSKFSTYQVAFTIAIIASLETLLNVEAVDKIDPLKRRTSANQELKAQGLGNIVSGLIGGLPITAVIVRGAANVNAGAKTKTSTVFHGLLLALSFFAIPDVLMKIPFASLASILLVIGYKLTKVSIYLAMYRSGANQFVPFIATVLAILLTDLLIGVGVGMFLAVFFILRVNMKNFYYTNRIEQLSDREIRLALSEEVTFLNKAAMRNLLDNIPKRTKIVIDASKSVFIDDDVLEIIFDFLDNAHQREIEVELIGFKKEY